MKKSYGCSDPKIIAYAKKVFQPEDPILKEARERSLKEGLPPIQVGDMDALHIEIITRVTQAKKAVEIGTLGGYSGISILKGMGKIGKLFTFEFNPHHAEVAKESFKNAGFEKNVEVLVGEAVKNLPKINKNAPFDLVFIDADKENYPNYLKWAEQHLRVGGVVLADNTFGFGKIADHTSDQEIVALRQFNHDVAHNGHFRATILPTGEGLTLAVKVK